jgi:hypothetical protein
VSGIANERFGNSYGASGYGASGYGSRACPYGR